jgi:hypothetical protein
MAANARTAEIRPGAVTSPAPPPTGRPIDTYRDYGMIANAIKRLAHNHGISAGLWAVTCRFLAFGERNCELNPGRAGQEITNQARDSVNRQETWHGEPEVSL